MTTGSFSSTGTIKAHFPLPSPFCRSDSTWESFASTERGIAFSTAGSADIVGQNEGHQVPVLQKREPGFFPALIAVCNCIMVSQLGNGSEIRVTKA